MGTREVYEEKLRSGHLYHDPTINPGLGTPRCPRCLALVDPNSGKGEWTITSVLHDATAVAGSGIGGLLSAIHGFNTGIPLLQNRLKGPKWLPFIVGLPPLLAVSGVTAAFGVLSKLVADGSLGFESWWGNMFSGFSTVEIVAKNVDFVTGYMLPRFAQLTVTSYYATSSASHHVISLLTRRIEEGHMSQLQQEKQK